LTISTGGGVVFRRTASSINIRSRVSRYVGSVAIVDATGVCSEAADASTGAAPALGRRRTVTGCNLAP
jgi:hypothetical protein